MELKKGSKVEVMNKTTFPTPWSVAKVVSRNMQTCNVRYDRRVEVSKVPDVIRSYDVDAKILPESRVVSSKKRASPFCLDAASNKKLKDDEQRIYDSCSVGSCSNSPYETLSRAESSNAPRDDDDDDDDDDDEDEDGGAIHRLELHAYRFTLDALFASGPLTWDKEALLTNLRINLHISNDEHLMHLKNLISTH